MALLYWRSQWVHGDDQDPGAADSGTRHFSIVHQTVNTSPFLLFARKLSSLIRL